ncbi:MAG TPA: hypothetical protein VF455_04745 [Chryseobacterium sp.]
MKKFIALILIIQSLSVFGQKIFKDENDNIISEEVYNNRKLIQGEFKACNDSLQICKIIINRSEQGNIETDKLLKDLENLLDYKIDKNQPTIITFHPGKDRCNSTGTATATSQYLWHKEKENLSDKIKKSNYLYIYKDKTNIKTIKKLKWFKDPKNIIENTFFQYHYPCSSYVIIYKNKYRSYFGEFSQNQVYNDLKEIIK